MSGAIVATHGIQRQLSTHFSGFLKSNMTDTGSAIAALDCLNPFMPNRWWRGGWMQTISIKAIRPELDVDQWKGMTRINVLDENSGDKLTGYHLPPQDCKRGKPLVAVFHGMGGHAQSGYMRSIASRLLSAHYPVLLWNNRGAGTSSDSCSQFHHPGRTDDLALLVDYLNEHHHDWVTDGLCVVGFSLGTNPMLKYLAKQQDAVSVRAAASISAPLDMEITSKNLRTGMNRVFDRYLLNRQCCELLRSNADLSSSERQTIESASSVWELDDRFTSKRFHYNGASEYYRANSARYVLDEITAPTLFIHAEDDPVVNIDVYSERQWDDQGPLYPAVVKNGGHTGFLGRRGTRWHEQCVVEFFDWILASA